MKDTNQLPPHTITIRDHPEPRIMQWSDLELAAIKKYAECYALQARAQVQGEPFGYIHHFAAHDESGALIDTTWEADGCADPLPHPTFPSMWKWAHCTPFYTTPQPAQATQAEAQQPATPKPVGFTYQAEIEYADSTGGNGAFWRVPPDLDDEAVPLYTHPAPSVPDVDFELQELREIERAMDDFADCGETDVVDTLLLRAVQAGFLECTHFHVANRGALQEAIDAARLAAKDTK